MSKYKIVKCPTIPELEGVEYESVIIKDMTLLKLVKQIAADVANIKVRLDKQDKFNSQILHRLDRHDEFIQYVKDVFVRNNLK